MAISATGVQTYFNIPQPAYNQCTALVVAAQTAWAGMVLQFAAENLAMNIPAATAQLLGTALEEVMLYGNSGSLWLAYAALSQVEITPAMAPYLTAARIQWMKNQMVEVIATLQTING